MSYNSSVKKRSHESLQEEEPPLQIAIIGGGLAGLACALAIQNQLLLSPPLESRIGTVTVYERDELFSDRRQGFGLTLTNNPKGPLAVLGVLDECIQSNCPSTCHYVFDTTGKVLGYYGRAFKPDMDQIYDSSRIGNLRIPRQRLRKMLEDKLVPDTVKWNMKLIDYTEEEEGIELDFGNCKVKVDVLIGADGFNSVVRQLKDTKVASKSTSSLCDRTYMGICVILGLSTLSHPLIDRRGFYVLDGIHRLFVMPFQISSEKEPQLTMWQLSFAGLTEDEALIMKSSPPESLLRIALDKTSGWFPMVSTMIASTELKEVWCTALYDRATMTPRKRDDPESRVVVLGDAYVPFCIHYVRRTSE
jgi:2-polyprenyl-6-methoxyphenol hydroxylase-like FAD-dependent oxidoreductase